MPIKLWFLSWWEAIYFEGLRLAALTRSASLPACPFEEREGRAGWAAQFSLRYCRLKAQPIGSAVIQHRPGCVFFM